MRMAELIQWGAERWPEFFLRTKINGEWEAGWGKIAGERTVRADTAIATLRELHRKHLIE